MENRTIIDYYRAMDRVRQKLRSILHALGTYLKTDMIYLTKGGFWLTLNNVVTAPLVFITSIVFANRIPAYEYGVYKFLLSIMGILSITTLSGMGSILSQAVARGREGSLFLILKTKIRWGLFGSAASLVVSANYFIHHNTTLGVSFLIAAIFIPIMDSLNIYQDYLLGKKLFRDSSVSYSISQLVAVIVMIGTLFLTKNVIIIFGVYLSSWTLIRFGFFLRTIEKYPPNNETDPSTIPYGKRSSFIDFLATIIGSIDQAIIFHFLGAVELALFSFASAPVTQLVGLFKNIPALAMPKMAARPIQEIDSLLHKRILYAFLVAVALSGVYMLAAPFIYHLFFPKYIDSINLSRVFSLTLLFAIPQTILGPAVSSKVTSIPPKMLHLWNIPGFLSTVFLLATVQSIGLISIIYARLILVASSFIVAYYLWHFIVKKDRQTPSLITIDTN